MFQSFYTGLSGLFSFSKNLDTVSNNIANMSTPGYRGKDAFYKSLNSGDGAGHGTQLDEIAYRFTNGDIKQTGNVTDLAITGEGFFVLLQDDNTLYTRAGQFSFDQSGNLIDKNSGGTVAALDDNGQVVPFNIDAFQVSAPEASTSISLSGNLSSGGVSHEISSVSVINALGEEKFVTLSFSNNSSVTTGSWLVDITDQEGNVIKSGEIRFDNDGTPLNSANSLTFDLADSMGGKTPITLNFGDNGSFAQSTSVDGGGTSTLQASVEDGLKIGSLSALEFQSDGSIEFTYSNGQKVTGPKLAMAKFANEQALELVNGAVFKADDTSSRVINIAGQSGIGTIEGKSIELSNVDLSQEFADMLIIQRGYQASSRVLNAADQLLDKLYENTRGG
ncbi:flagellar basal-body rod protein FlgF [Catenovulum sp. SM1970]|uniref:flagellar basal-body rod protein FlgF n=1 Tax=Marinifaba aquimaris TaxID=2741323 RepID=UPI001572974F|nr:flagellar basal-body rod protein FlgF [Marinifaba aquimaris]NTS77379.1 flagellar basal-body rod protein FlgF [Marinifaba aquimaris]